jgi:biopolymer transport protein ExbD
VLTPSNEILWNATTIDAGELVRNLNATKAINPEPELQFEPEPQASYDLSAQVLNIIKQSGVSKFGFVGNEKYRVFDKDTSGVNPGG